MYEVTMKSYVSTCHVMCTSQEVSMTTSLLIATSYKGTICIRHCEAGRDTTAQTAKVRHAHTNDMCICMCSMHTKVLNVGRAWEWSAHNSYHVHRWNCISAYGAHGILDTASTIISLIPYLRTSNSLGLSMEPITFS